MSNDREMQYQRRNISPGTAAFLAFIPFLGSIYNGTYLRAVYQFTFIVLLELFCDAADIVWLGIIGGIVFYIYTIVDAYRVADQIKTGQPISGHLSLKLGKSPLMVQGILLIALGALFLLNNFGVRVSWFFEKFWPLLLVGGGLYLLYNYRQQKQKSADPASPIEDNVQFKPDVKDSPNPDVSAASTLVEKDIETVLSEKSPSSRLSEEKETEVEESSEPKTDKTGE